MEAPPTTIKEEDDKLCDEDHDQEAIGDEEVA